ncbi:hypothetical protein ABWC92_004627 [Escherichia coli]|jgi:predicted  nucleic acid-binding Zn-ribbon protein
MRKLYKEEMAFAKKKLAQLENMTQRIDDMNDQWEAEIGQENPGLSDIKKTLQQVQRNIYEQIGQWNRTA